MAPDPKATPQPTLRRLPQYHRFLKRLLHEGQHFVSCTHIAHEFDLDPTQVRKDLACTGIVGKPRVGYEVETLIATMEHHLGWDNVTEAFLVGVGHLGTALLGYDGFAQYGVNLIAAFDVDPAKIGTRVAGKQVLALSKLPDLAQRMHVHIGIITTPAAAAQEVADLMVQGGIKGLWNFAPVHLKVPRGVVVENQQLAAGLAILGARVAESVRLAQRTEEVSA